MYHFNLVNMYIFSVLYGRNVRNKVFYLSIYLSINVTRDIVDPTVLYTLITQDIKFQLTKVFIDICQLSQFKH